MENKKECKFKISDEIREITILSPFWIIQSHIANDFLNKKLNSTLFVSKDEAIKALSEPRLASFMYKLAEKFLYQDCEEIGNFVSFITTSGITTMDFVISSLAQLGNNFHYNFCKLWDILDSEEKVAFYFRLKFNNLIVHYELIKKMNIRFEDIDEKNAKERLLLILKQEIKALSILIQTNHYL